MHHPKCPLGIAQRREHCNDALQAQLGGFDFVPQRVEEAHGIWISHLALRRYTSQADPIINAVPASSFPSNSQILRTSPVGIALDTMVSSVIAIPETAATRQPAFHALANI